MGLDMKLLKREKSSTSNEDWEKICYWRKANQIRGWFAKNLDDFHDNGLTLVTKNDLELLLDDCEEVFYNHDLCDILPTTSGCFFGSREYDEGYFEDIRFTREKLIEILDTIDFDKYDIAYYEWY